MNAMGQVSFTPTEQRLLSILTDGETHTTEELQAVLNDDQAVPATLKMHLSNFRKKLLLQSKDIYHRHSSYRMVRLLTPEDRQ